MDNNCNVDWHDVIVILVSLLLAKKGGVGGGGAMFKKGGGEGGKFIFEQPLCLYIYQRMYTNNLLSSDEGSIMDPKLQVMTEFWRRIVNH